MLTYQAFYQEELHKLLMQEIDRIKENLASGLSTPDFLAYKHQVGLIDGLKMAVELMSCLLYTSPSPRDS